MNIVRTAFTILSGQGQALNVDAQQFYTHLYRLLPQLASEEGRDLIPHLEEIIKLSFLDRKKKVSFYKSSTGFWKYFRNLNLILTTLLDLLGRIRLTTGMGLCSLFGRELFRLLNWAAKVLIYYIYSDVKYNFVISKYCLLG